MDVKILPPRPRSPQPMFAVEPPESADEQGSQKCLAILTSGGDSQGMNSALRACVRMAIFQGARVFFVFEGYQGLVEGGEYIKETTWWGVSHIMGKGGTIIGTARCQAFRQRDGRRKAAHNLVKCGINNLVVVGGDGSLTGANVFREEWPGLLQELADSGDISATQQKNCGHLNIVGLVGSIDNDMCGTDMTLGADSALHRIMEAVDAISSTASSHQRSFVLEVMGRHCGYLALISSLACGADWCLIPESPPSDGWEDAMCKQLEVCRNAGRRMSLVIVAEGAVDSHGKAITSQDVKKVLESRLGHDTRITVLGHVQRGGSPSAYDRIMGCRVGAAAALAVLQATATSQPVLVGIKGNKVVRSPLMECVRKTQAVAKAMKDGDFRAAISMREGTFNRHWRIFRALSHMDLGSTPKGGKFTFAVIHVGAPAGGMNSCTRAFVRLAVTSGHTVYGVCEGFKGLAAGTLKKLGWMDVDGWNVAGGSYLGTNRSMPTDSMFPFIAQRLEEYKIDGLVLIGGFEGYHSLCKMEEARTMYPAFRIPLIGISATISNNVPGTDHGLGSDTALNIIVEATDRLKQSAVASRKRVFVVETMGGNCGYLATLGGLAGGADAAYIAEEPFDIATLQNDVRHLIGKFEQGIWRGIILRNEKCSQHYTIDFMTNLLAAEGKGVFTTRSSVLGHIQQGGLPSPYDRLLGVSFGSCALNFLEEQAVTAKRTSATSSPDSACMVGIRGSQTVYTSLEKLREKTDFSQRVPKQQWWMSLRPLLRVLAKHRDFHFGGEDEVDDSLSACSVCM